MTGKRGNGSISVFLALVLVIIISLILTGLEAAYISASDDYAEVLLKTATESVLAEYYGPLYEDYHIFAIDSGYGTKNADLGELKNHLEEYLGANVWDFEAGELKINNTKQLFAEGGNVFLEQAAEYEKYTAATGIADEIIGRVKVLGDQKKITKVLEKRLDIEDELAVIDKYTIELMKLIDGVNINPKIKKSSLKTYTIESYFIKRLFIHTVSPTMCGINNPAVYDRLKNIYENPIPEVVSLREALPGYARVTDRRIRQEEEIKAEEETLAGIQEKINETERKLSENDATVTAETAELEALRGKLDESVNQKEKTGEGGDDAVGTEAEEKYLKDRISEIGMLLDELGAEAAVLRAEHEEYEAEAASEREKLAELQKILEEILLSENRQRVICETKAMSLYSLFTNVSSELNEVISVVDKISKKQEKVRPMVENYESLVDTVAPILSDDIKEGLTDSLDLMKAYAGLENSRLDITDFASILVTAQYDAALMSQINAADFILPSERNYDSIMKVHDRLEGIDEILAGFGYDGFVFDYSGIKENALESEIESEFEKNVSEGYMSLFLDDTSKLSDNKLVSGILPSLWYEVSGESNADAEAVTSDAGDKSGRELLSDTDEGSGITDIAEMLENGIDVLGTKVLSAMYMTEHFKSYSKYSAMGDTVLDYELEYILSGCDTDMGNLSAAATKIMLMRMLVTIIYTMTNSDLKGQAEAVAMATMGFTGLPFLVTIVKYLILFYWATAQAVIETAAVLRGKKVPVITNSDSFCLTLPELAVFPTLISKKAEDFNESELYLDYNNYLFIMLLLQGREKQAARAMDLIQENIRYRYNDDFLLNNAIVGFEAEAVFTAKTRYSSVFAAGMNNEGNSYGIKVKDVVCY